MRPQPKSTKRFLTKIDAGMATPLGYWGLSSVPAKKPIGRIINSYQVHLDAGEAF
jgi:hypothetical protein